MKRPRGVTIIGVLLLLQGLLLAALLLWATELDYARPEGTLPSALAQSVAHLGMGNAAQIGVQVVLAGLLVASGVAILRLRPWAWLVAMTLQGLTLAGELLNNANGRPDYLNMLLGVAIVFTLNTRTVRQAFEPRHPAPHGPIPTPDTAPDAFIPEARTPRAEQPTELPR